MARARNIKPGFFKNEELAECDPLARVLFAGLWTIADREGRMEYRPKRIKAEILPYDDCDVVALLNELCRRGFIIRYEVDQLQYIVIPTFTEHQNPHKNEVESVFPPIDHEGVRIIQIQETPEKSRVVQYNSGATSENIGTTRADSLLPITDSLLPITLKRKSRARPKRDPTEGKVKYAEIVYMTEEEHGKLVKQHGEDAVKRMVEILDNYKGANGKKYDSDYRAILSWVVERYKQEVERGKSGRTDTGNSKKNPNASYGGAGYDYQHGLDKL
jgi:hypothetical protein